MATPRQNIIRNCLQAKCQNPAGRRQGQFPVIAHKELQPQFPLHEADPFTDPGLGKEHDLPCFCEASVFRRCQKQFQILNLYIIDVDIPHMLLPFHSGLRPANFAGILRNEDFSAVNLCRPKPSPELNISLPRPASIPKFSDSHSDSE